MRVWLSAAALSGLLSAPVYSAELSVSVEIPRMTVAEYHRPYVAIWLERPDQTVATNLAVWYDLKQKKNEGTTWLKDMRQWWRRSGRDLKMPVDGLSSATKPPGVHQVTFGADNKGLAALPAGQYQLVIEAAREVGGRELLRIPLEWRASTAQSGKAKGQHELGAVALNVKP
jgi:hypothetical protein